MRVKTWKSRKLIILAAYVLLNYGTMWGFAAARVDAAAWQAFGTVALALLGPVTAWLGVQGLIDHKQAGAGGAGGATP